MLDRFALHLMEATEPETYYKSPGPVAEGGKATGDGLLRRYHLYLALELEMLGHEVYGNARYACSYIPLDGTFSALPESAAIGLST